MSSSPHLSATLLICGLCAACTMNYEMAPTAGPCPPASVETESPDVSWIAPERSGDREAHEKWCRSVGPMAIDSTPSTRFVGWSELDSLAIVTWNLHGGAGDLLEFLNGELNLTCESGEAAVSDGFSPFVLVLQEIFRRSEQVPVATNDATVPPKLKEKPRATPRIDIVEAARRCGLSLFYVPSMRNGADDYEDGREDRGNAILSTLPLSGFMAIELPFEAQRRVAVSATVRRSDGDSLRAVSLHLDVASSLLRMMTTANSTRQRQGFGLLESLSLADCHPECDLATVVAGDFNTWSSNETVLRHFRRAFPESPAWNGEPTRSAYPADHIFFRVSGGSGIELVAGSYRRIQKKYGSDHNARIMWVR
jgi:endonuclease/exonuclease/phosphatase family metal-dependent hydrolase